LNAHFALSTLSDSLATSFAVFAVAALIRVAVLGDTRAGTAVTLAISATAAAFMRTEKSYVVGALVLACAVAAVRARRHVRSIAILLVAFALPVLVVPALNRATQTAPSNRPAPTLTMAAFDRTVWPRMQRALPFVDAQTRALVTAQEVRTFDASGLQVPPMVARLRAADGGGDRHVNAFTRAALRCCFADIVVRASYDFVRYLASPVTYIGEIVTGADTPTAWTASRMAGAHPALTWTYVAAWIVFFLAIQVPLLFYRRSEVDRGAVWIMLGAVVVNGAFFALVTGLNANIRYGLIGFVLVCAYVVWANARTLYALSPDS
jgi:hypothetical protein